MNSLPTEEFLDSASHEAIVAALRFQTPAQYAAAARDLQDCANAAAFFLAVLLWQAATQFKDDISYRQLVGLLTENGVIQRNEDRFGDKSYLSKLKKIGEYSHLVLRLVRTGLIVGLAPMYELALYYEACEEFGIGADQNLDDHIRENPGDLTGAAIKQLRKDLRVNPRPPVEVRDSLASSAAAINSDAVRNRPQIDLLLALPQARDVAAICKDFQAGFHPVCTSLTNQLSATAGCVVVTELSHIPVIVERLLSPCGFWAPTYYLLNSPAGADITSAGVVVVASRSRDRRAQLISDLWQSEVENHDLADRCFPDAACRTQLFGHLPPRDWHSFDFETDGES